MTPRISTWWRKYRIVRDAYAGFEVQRWFIWWPFWTMSGFCNTHSTVEKARAFAANNANLVVEENL